MLVWISLILFGLLTYLFFCFVVEVVGGCFGQVFFLSWYVSNSGSWFSGFHFSSVWYWGVLRYSWFAGASSVSIEQSWCVVLVLVAGEGLWDFQVDNSFWSCKTLNFTHFLFPFTIQLWKYALPFLLPVFSPGSYGFQSCATLCGS